MRAAAALLLLLAAATEAAGEGADEPLLYRDATAPIPSRVQDLLSRMTTEEKVAQLLELWGGGGVFDKLLRVYNTTGVGAVMIGGGAPNATCRNDPACRIVVQNALQRRMVEGSRLGIPITFTQETMTSGAHNGTSFPHPAAQGSSWNMSLVHEIGKAVGSEAYYSGVDRGYSPVLQVVTDPRFGRWHENFGGDGLLVAACATAAVTGLQGDGGSGPNSYLTPGHIVAEAKHFGACAPHHPHTHTHTHTHTTTPPFALTASWPLLRQTAAAQRTARLWRSAWARCTTSISAHGKLSPRPGGAPSWVRASILVIHPWPSLGSADTCIVARVLL